MRTFLNLVIVIFLGLAGNLAHAAHTQARLILSAETARPGDTIFVGVDLKMESGWHTYWKNPGEAGQATEIKWALPPGVTAGDIEWPLPEKLPPAEVTTYGYENEVILLVPLTLATNLPAGTLNLAAKVSWLECKEACIPAGAEVQTALAIGNETKASPDAALIESWKKLVPFTMSDSASDYAWWESLASGDTRTLVIGHLTPKTANTVKFDFIKYDSVDFFPAASEHFEIQGATEIVSAFPSDIRLRKVVKKFDGDWPTQIFGVLVLQHGSWRSGNESRLAVGDEIPADAGPPEKILPPKSLTDALPSPLLRQMLFYAFLGGLILNIMPCVLPVIALKILGFVGEARSDPRRVRKLGLIYALGVLVSFLALADIVIGVKAAGHHAGWGMQFGSPVFIVCLTTLVTLVALNLFGVFEVVLGGRALMRRANSHRGTARRARFSTACWPRRSPRPAPRRFWRRRWVSPLPKPSVDHPGFSHRRPRPGFTVYFVELESGVAEIIAQAGRVDGKIQDRDGLPHAGDGRVAFPRRRERLRQGCFLARHFSRHRRVRRLGLRRICATRPQAKIARRPGALILLGGGYFFALEKELDWREADAGSQRHRLAERIGGRH